MTTFISILVGLALATAVGFRIFIPMLFMSILSQIGWFTLPEEMTWLDTDIAFLILLFGTIFEIVTYLVPGLDNIMDIIDMPIAIIAGVCLMFSVVQIEDPMAHWIVALIIGGAVPAIMKAFKATIRGTLTIFTGGLGNVALAVFEVVASFFIAFIAIFYLV